jgi:hypothetical protein
MTRKKTKGRWVPGESGNPAGKLPGTLSTATKLRKLIDVEKLIERLQTAAFDGDVQAARVLLERALPVYRTTAEPVELPELADASDLPDKAKKVLAAVGDGRVPPDVGAQLLSAIGTVSRVADVEELARRIAALEKKGNEKSGRSEASN